MLDTKTQWNSEHEKKSHANLTINQEGNFLYKIAAG